jgi:glycosyltransferase involved in cell wall biosynthesis
MTLATLHAVLPGGVDDPDRPSGGNTYDRRVCDGLSAAGWNVREHLLPGDWPQPDSAAPARLAESLDLVPDGALALVDGLIASAAADVLVPAAQRVRLVVVVHMPLGATDEAARAGERAVLSSAAAVITTSEWTRDQLLAWYPLDANRVQVARPGVDAADAAPGTPAGGHLLCVAAVAAHKGQDVLLDALTGITDLRWRCRLVGPLDRDPAFVATLRAATTAAGLDDRIEFVGPLTGADLDLAYAGADLLVLPSRGETYGMVVGEALAHAVPVLVSEVGGVREAIGETGAGLLVAPGDHGALAAAVRSWLTDPDLREARRRAALERRASLPGWPATVAKVAAALTAATPVR